MEPFAWVRIPASALPTMLVSLKGKVGMFSRKLLLEFELRWQKIVSLSISIVLRSAWFIRDTQITSGVITDADSYKSLLP